MSNAAFTRWKKTRSRILNAMSFSEWRTVAIIRFGLQGRPLSQSIVRKHLNAMVDSGCAIWRKGPLSLRKEFLRTR
jgi:hypothetical protein